MFEEYFDEFVPSVELREYLKNEDLDTDKVSDVIYHSPNSLEKKYIALRQLEKEETCNEDSHCTVYLNSIKKAMELIENDGVFSLEIGEGKQGETNLAPTFDGVFDSYSDVMEYVEQYYHEYDPEYTWYEINKWIQDEEGKLFSACTYYVIKKEIYFITLNYSILDEYYLGIAAGENLNIPVPYQVGDIVETTFAPFAGKKKMISLEVGDNVDCCCLQALYQEEDGLWNIGAVKHGHVGVDAFPKISPLYYMETFAGMVSDDERILQDISRFINGDEEKGSAIWNWIYELNRAVSKEEINSYIEEYQ